VSRRFKVGVQLHPQLCSVDELRQAWRAVDALGVDSIWIWDHFFPLYGDSEGAHYECWTLLAAMAAETRAAAIGPLVSCCSYRNADLVADMARTVDHISGGRLILGLGGGWSERDYHEYGYRFASGAERLQSMEQAIGRVRARLHVLNPPPKGPVPLLVGGAGEKVALRIVAQHAQLWNTFGTPDLYARKNAVLTDWCVRLGRDPAEIERTVLLDDPDWPDGDIANYVVEPATIEAFLEAGAQHMIVACGYPFRAESVHRLLELSEARPPRGPGRDAGGTGRAVPSAEGRGT
jgi:probable F420-dependent oxidoreductase